MDFIPINKDNYRECIKLKVKEEQIKFVSNSNANALAKAYVYRDNSYPFAIYEEKEMIGFILYREMPDLGNYLIEKIMIKESYQGMGYGKKAMERIIKIMKEENKFNKICVCCDTGNRVALALYNKFGFKQVEEEEEHEIVLGIEW